MIATVLLLAGLPLLARRFFGPPSPGRAGRSLRVLFCAAILALLPAFAIVEVFANLTPAPAAYRSIFCIAQGWSSIQGCGGVPEVERRSALGGRDRAPADDRRVPGLILFLTSRRSRVTRSTLAIGTGTGLVFGWSCTRWHPSG